jgi:hypothetical protein
MKGTAYSENARTEKKGNRDLCAAAGSSVLGEPLFLLKRRLITEAAAAGVTASQGASQDDDEGPLRALPALAALKSGFRGHVKNDGSGAQQRRYVYSLSMLVIPEVGDDEHSHAGTPRGTSR